MSNFPRLDETGLNTLAQALADATEQQGVIKVCETEAEWNQKTQAEKDDPNIYWFLPWRTSTSGEINDNTTAPDKVWSSQKVNSENTALKAMVTDDYVFSPTKSYVAGDWLIHNNILYEVLVACTGVTPPNATYYDPITLHDLKNRVNTLESSFSEIQLQGFYPILGKYDGKVQFSVPILSRYTHATLSDTSIKGSIYGDKGSGLGVNLSNGTVYIGTRGGVCYMQFDCSPSYSTVLTVAHSGIISIDSSLKLNLS